MGFNRFITYAVSADRDTLVDLIDRGCIALEKACGSSPLLTERRGEKPEVAIKDRKKYLRTALKRSGCPFSLSNGRFGGIRGDGYVDSAFVGVAGQFYELGNIVYKFNIQFQAETWNECEGIFVAVGDAINAYSANIISSVDTLEMFRNIHWELTQRGEPTVAELKFEPAIAGLCPPHLNQMTPADWTHYQLNLAEFDPPVLPLFLQRKPFNWRHYQGLVAKLDTTLIPTGLQLPRFNNSPSVVRSSPFQPKELGWINYWSAQTCEYLGFPDPVRDRDLLANSYQTPAGAWVIKLCTEPLDLNRLDHLKILVDTYARFPKLGIRLPESPPIVPPPLSYPQNTIFVRGDWQYIAEQIVPFFLAQGFIPVEPIAEPAAKAVSIGVLPGAEGWAIIKCVPVEYFGGAVASTKEIRMAALCCQLGCDGFMLNAYNAVEAILLEVNSRGRNRVSGFYDVETEPASMNALQAMAAAKPSVISFSLLATGMQVDMLNLDDCGQLAQQIYSEFAGANADLCDNACFAKALNDKELQTRQSFVFRFIPN